MAVDRCRLKPFTLPLQHRFTSSIDGHRLCVDTAKGLRLKTEWDGEKRAESFLLSVLSNLKSSLPSTCLMLYASDFQLATRVPHVECLTIFVVRKSWTRTCSPVYVAREVPANVACGPLTHESWRPLRLCQYDMLSPRATKAKIFSPR
ncbi:hypothetical protein M8J77_019421 [Diaphorina citri]|nr:hypothetical protein M8J77_019421 [Diaphorina citri]